MLFGLNTFNEIDHLHRQMDQLLRGLSEAPSARVRSFVPRFSVSDLEDALLVSSPLPGLNLEKLDINVVGRRLSIAGEPSQKEIPEDAVWHRQERAFGAFEQSLQLPEHVDAEKVEAEYRHGILSIRLPKVAAAQPRKIAVKSA